MGAVKEEPCVMRFISFKEKVTEVGALSTCAQSKVT